MSRRKPPKNRFPQPHASREWHCVGCGNRIRVHGERVDPNGKEAYKCYRCGGTKWQ
jgi:hypothetical protein